MPKIAKENLLFLKMIRDERVLRKVSQEDLARRMNVTQSVISKNESGDRQMSFLELRDFCITLGLKADIFVKKFERELMKLRDK